MITVGYQSIQLLIYVTWWLIQ